MRWRTVRTFTFCAFLGWLPMAAQAAPNYAQTGAKQPSVPQKPQVGAEDRPYDNQLFRLAEILGTLHYLRELCGANEGQLWREHMQQIVNAEGSTALRRAKLVESFNRGYRDYARTYRTCTQPALTAIQRFMDQASTIADTLVASDR